jgi:hypothetical protein
MFAMAESAVVWRSAAILLATKSGHEVPLANAVNAMTYAFIPEKTHNIKKGCWFYFKQLYLSSTTWRELGFLCLERKKTCDTTYKICQFSYNVSYPTDEKETADEGNPTMDNLIRRHKSKQKSPWYKKQLPGNSC